MEIMAIIFMNSRNSDIQINEYVFGDKCNSLLQKFIFLQLLKNDFCKLLILYHI